MEIIGTIGARCLGKYGFLILSLIRGMVSSASTTAAAATMAIHGKLPPDVAGVATVFASIAGALVNLPLVERQMHDRRITWTLTIISAALVTLVFSFLLYDTALGEAPIESRRCAWSEEIEAASDALPSRTLGSQIQIALHISNKPKRPCL